LIAEKMLNEDLIILNTRKFELMKQYWYANPIAFKSKWANHGGDEISPSALDWI
jgi:hypothetical protein